MWEVRAGCQGLCIHWHLLCAIRKASMEDVGCGDVQPHSRRLRQSGWPAGTHMPRARRFP